MRRKNYSIEVKADPITIHLNDFYDDVVVDYVVNVLGYSVAENRSSSSSVLDEVAQQLKEEFLEGLDFHQLNRLVKNKKQVLEYLEQLTVASQK
jgi:hypothetical protein